MVTTIIITHILEVGAIMATILIGVDIIMDSMMDILTVGMGLDMGMKRIEGMDGYTIARIIVAEI